MTTITANGLTAAYGRTEVLHGLDLSIGRGVTGVLGPNGAGKTSLLRVLATSAVAVRGIVRIFGHDPNDPDDRTEIRRRLGYLPQETGFYPHFTVFDLVDYVAILKEHTARRPRHDEVRRVLAEVDLTSNARTRVRKLSTGMRRRLGLATALLGNPELLVLDEPMAGLDAEQRIRAHAVVRQSAERGTVVLSTHVADDIGMLCERVLVLDGGRVAFDGSPAGLTSLARGKVSLTTAAPSTPSLGRQMEDGRYRMVGDPPEGAEVVEPTVEDGYLLLVGRRPASDAAA